MKINAWIVSWAPRHDGDGLDDNTISLHGRYIEVYPTRKAAREAMESLKGYYFADDVPSSAVSLKLTKQVLEL